MEPNFFSAPHQRKTHQAEQQILVLFIVFFFSFFFGGRSGVERVASGQQLAEARRHHVDQRVVQRLGAVPLLLGLRRLPQPHRQRQVTLINDPDWLIHQSSVILDDCGGIVLIIIFCFGFPYQNRCE